jgi:heme-degrading monooxygenase HmoA
MPALKSVSGYRGVRLWQRSADAGIELVVITYWDSLDSVRGFAGEEIGRAVVADEAAALLSEFDDRVRHYELVVADEA